MCSKRSWYLVYTKPRLEQTAEENLVRQGYVTYLPKVYNLQRRNGKYTKTLEALFPRYLFIHLDTETDNWVPIRSTIGVSQMVRFGGISAIVPDELIVNLQSNEDEKGLQQTKSVELKTGDQVKILEGPFAGLHGIYQQQKSAERVAVLLDIVGRNTELTLSIHDLHIA